MTQVVRGFAVLGFAVVLAGGCSINHRSGDFTCQTQADCSSGRICSDGFCVVTQLDSGVKGDAPSSTCPSPCTSCNATTKSCTIDCEVNPAACSQAITCPAGWDCNVACSSSGSCRNAISCIGSKSCTITCSSAQSCKSVTCGAGRCNVACTGTGSCQRVSCGASCACDVACQGTACTNLTCRTTPDCSLMLPLRGCTSLTAGCNTCL